MSRYKFVGGIFGLIYRCIKELMVIFLTKMISGITRKELLGRVSAGYVSLWYDLAACRSKWVNQNGHPIHIVIRKQ